MKKQRLLDCYSLLVSDHSNPSAQRFDQAQWDQISPQTHELLDWVPSWQNDIQSLSAISDQVLCLTLFTGRELKAFAAVHPGTGTIHQIAVRAGSRRKGIAAALLADIQNRLPGTSLRVINACSTDRAFRGLMIHLGATEMIGQHELKMDL